LAAGARSAARAPTVEYSAAIHATGFNPENAGEEFESHKATKETIYL